MQRYFSISSTHKSLSSDNVFHMQKVMRMKVGDKFELVFNNEAYICEITNMNPFSFSEIEKINNSSEIENDVTLFFALSKGDKNEFVMQKATELGVSKIVLLSSKRSISKMSNEDFLRKKNRYEKIVLEAAEQSKRTKVPAILGVFPISNIPSELIADYNFVAYEDESGFTNNSFELLNSIKKNESVSIVIGSEGGLEKEEVEKLSNSGFKIISLGKRILRCETAAVYALSVLGFLLERK